jgi:hypothetical protein
MRIFFTAFCFFQISVFYATAQTGFFLIIENKEHCAHPVTSIDFQEEYCITEIAIIKESEFKAEGELQSDLVLNSRFFYIRFTKSGFETLKMICEHLPEKHLVLVVNGKAIGTYDGKKLKPTERMPIIGKADSKEINWVFENLKNRK